MGSHDTTEASSKRLPRADDAYSQSAPVHASDADAPTSRSARRARGRPGKMNGGLCQLPGYLFTASHKGQAPPNHDATANSPLLLWVWGCRCDVPRCAVLARLALYSIARARVRVVQRIAEWHWVGSTPLHTVTRATARHGERAPSESESKQPLSAGPATALPPASRLRRCAHATRRYGTVRGGILVRVGVGTVPRGSARQELVVARARLYFLVACRCVPLSLPRAGFLDRWTDGCSARSSPPAGRRGAYPPGAISLSPSSSARLDSFRPSAVVKLTQRR